MNRKSSMLLTGLALIILYLLVKFSQTYYLSIQLPIANTLTKITFGIVLIVGTICIVILLFFKKWIYEKRKQLFLSLCIFFFGIISIEVMLRVVDNRPMRFFPHPYLNYIGTPNYKSADGLNMHNAQGFRGPDVEMPKPEGRIRIAILGGSTTYESFVKDWKEDFARQLQRELHQMDPKMDVEVINAGLPGWDSWEDLVNLEFRLIDYDLDLIIPYEGTNEVHVRLVRPDAYKADNSGNKKQWDRKICLDISCLKIVQTITGFDTTSFNITAPTAALFPSTNEYNSVLGMTPMEALDKNPPIYFERNLRNIIAVARENNIDVLLATWAWSNQKDDYASSSHYERGFREQNDMIKKVAEMKNLPVYDFASEIPMDAKYWGDGRHNNQEGIALKSKLFAQFIIDNHILDKKEKL